MLTVRWAASIFAIRDWLEPNRLATCVWVMPSRSLHRRSPSARASLVSTNRRSSSVRCRKSPASPRVHPARSNRRRLSARTDIRPAVAAQRATVRQLRDRSRSRTSWHILRTYGNLPPFHNRACRYITIGRRIDSGRCRRDIPSSSTHTFGSDSRGARPATLPPESENFHWSSTSAIPTWRDWRFSTRRAASACSARRSSSTEANWRG